MSSIHENNKRIARNTLMLYIRMFLVMLISLYTVRVVLSILGEENYGIYNVVGGIVVMFSFLSRTLASASQRFFAFELGRKDYVRLNKVFNTTLVLYIIVILLIVLLAETVGVWFFRNKMTIPDERMLAATWVYHLSIAMFCITLLATPFQAVIIAREKMDIYAYIGVLEVVLKLGLVFMLPVIPVDKLIIYAILMLFNDIVINSIYVIYSRRHYEETRVYPYWDSSMVKEIASYSGWNIFGAVAAVCRSQGINILLNVFFTPVVNAARGLAYQVNTALNHFAQNFYTAVRPQVTKYYAEGDVNATLNLVFTSSKLTCYLMLFLAVPVIIFSENILNIWLVDVPEYTKLFVRLVIVIALIDSISNPLMTLAQATGKVSLYQSVVGTLLLLNLPVSWFFLHLGYGPEFTMYVAIAIAMIALFARLVILRRLVRFPVWRYVKVVLSRIFVCFVISLAISYFFNTLVGQYCSNIIVLLSSLSFSVLLTCVVIWIIGLTRNERKPIINYIITKIPCLKK